MADSITFIETLLNKFCENENTQHHLFVIKDGVVVKHSGTTILHQEQIHRIRDILLYHNIACICPALKDNYNLVISKLNDTNLVQYYQLLFACIPQLSCRNLVNQWVKIIEPRNHRLVEQINTDSLTTTERITLLISIIRNPNICLFQLKDLTDRLNFNIQIKKLLLELFYVAVHDHLFYNKHLPLHYLYTSISFENHLALERKSVTLAVSKLKTDDGSFTCISNVSNEQLNFQVFRLNEYTPLHMVLKPTIKKSQINSLTHC